jgi:hypothetical protein
MKTPRTILSIRSPLATFAPALALAFVTGGAVLLGLPGTLASLAGLPLGAREAQAATTPSGPTAVSSLSSMLDGFHWGSSHADVIKMHVQPGGIIDKDYDPALMQVQPGVEQKAIEADRDNHKAAFIRSYIEFNNIPTGYDTTEIHGEYTYRNKESLLYIERAGKKRYFFFIGDRLWKILDEVPLSAQGPLGTTFADATSRMNSALGVNGRQHVIDLDDGVDAPTVDWQDASTHLRLIDMGRSAGVASEDRATLQNLPQLRANRPADPLAVDPSIAAVTRGHLSDPDAASTAPPPNPAPTKKKKKHSK